MIALRQDGNGKTEALKVSADNPLSGGLVCVTFEASVFVATGLAATAFEFDYLYAKKEVLIQNGRKSGVIPRKQLKKEIMQMKKRRSYKLSPNGVRIPKHHIKWAPALAADFPSASDQMLFPFGPQISIHNLNILLSKADSHEPGKATEPIDVAFTDCSEVNFNDN